MCFSEIEARLVVFSGLGMAFKRERRPLLGTHIKIFIILIKLIFQNNISNKICGIFLILFGDMATFAVEVWSWKLFQI